uniref:Uncharacterized protein LOC111113053 isoform X2 n=1 Tax=Crassostrea virginica TaxID=6565 RepID=A0A8B8BTN2_CRAVI|nr:uncharacterized protein LOC111113053 isoform X2 [Crassostrea virginica]
MQAVFSLLVICALVTESQGDELTISTSFKNCDVLFSWDDLKKTYYHVMINNQPWKRVYEPKYTVKDALLRSDSIRINIRAEHSSKDNTLIYNVSTLESKIGDNVTLSWSVPFFPKTGGYNIYHLKNNKSKSIGHFSNNLPMLNQSKYRYLSRPYNSTCISFEIMDLTLDDAGYYTSGTSAVDAWSKGRAVVLIVFGYPRKPDIIGNLNVSIRSQLELTCSSMSTSAPDYYAKLEKLSYTWFMNNTEMGKGNNQMLSLYVTKDLRYNKYSCTAMGKKLESDQSDTVQINPLYQPDNISIDPEPELNNGRLTVKEGETIGPYDCSSDCNPPCEIKWKYKDINNNVHDASSNGYELSILKVNKNISLIRCVAIYEQKDMMRKDIELDIQCKYFNITNLIVLFY